MQLFNSPASPYGRKVMVLLHETDQLDDVEITLAMGSPLHLEKMPLEINPLGKIPALAHKNGPALFDSRVICRFLDDRAGGKLYPAAPDLYEALTLESMADGIVDAAVLIIYEMRLRSKDLYMEQWVNAQWAKITRALDAIEQHWTGFLNGDFNMGHIATGCALSFLDARLGDRDWRKSRPQLANWEIAFSQRDSMTKTLPKE